MLRRIGFISKVKPGHAPYGGGEPRFPKKQKKRPSITLERKPLLRVMPAKRKLGRPKQAIFKELDPTEVSVVERHKWLFLRYGKTIKGEQWDSWQVEVGAGRWKSKEAALAMKGEFLALLSKETNLPLHKVCTPIAAKARTDMVTPARRASQLTDTLSPMELEMPKKQKVPP